jgi:nitric oxide reductase subunit B
MSLASQNLTTGADDRVSNVLKWVLLAVAVISFALFFWATARTYEQAPPEPDQYITAGGATVMTGDEIVAGKGGFQKADLMDYGSLHGMGSYFGQDYTAFALVKLAALTENEIAQNQFGNIFDALAPGEQATVRDAMQRDLQGVDLTKTTVVLPDALAAALKMLRTEMADNLGKVDLTTGWTPAFSLNETERLQTADFIIYSAFTTVARRPGTTWSWTENWPYQPEVGNRPTTNTFVWTWASFCFTFLAFGGVLFIYIFWLETPDEPTESVLGNFGPLTPTSARSASSLS